ncbi:Fe-only nitrogenase accessory AnfO family protein [Eubacteriaceae bacterium ES3]|nr:Fe-only nitrogenase accessory AnfO family protein [Eubacteriaceae bacterium ES3]
MKKNFGMMAVFTDKNDNISEFSSMAVIKIYENLNDTWEISKSIAFSPDMTLAPGELRKKLKETAESIKPCRVIITSGIKGMAYQIFDQSGFIICESDSFDIELLDAIRQDLLETQKEDMMANTNQPTAPIPTDEPGRYFIDLDKLQKNRPDISSKMALMPFFEKGDFILLDVICEHFPPWFTERFPQMGLTFTIVEDSNKMTHVIVEKKGSVK